MKGLDKWSPLAVMYIVAVLGFILVCLTVIRHPPTFVATWTTDSITAFFAKVTLVLTLLSPVIALGVKVFVDAKVAAVKTTADAAHVNSTTAVNAINGPLSAATAEAFTAGIKTYAASGDLTATQQAVLERMKQRDLPTTGVGGVVATGGSGSG